MINHVRTLILNRGREGKPLDSLGEEYVPAAFVPRKLPPHLSLIHKTLFGSKPDRLFLNYRMQQIMSIIHASPLASEATRDDTRITYLPFRQDMFQTASKEVVVQDGDLIYPTLIGVPQPNYGSGIVKQTWDIELHYDGACTMQLLGQAAAPYSCTVTANEVVSIYRSNLQLLTTLPEAYTSLRVVSYAWPQDSIPQVMTTVLRAIGDGGVAALFPPEAAEPVATWRRVWFNQKLLVPRYAAFFLAFAKQVEQQPQEVS